MNNSPISPTQLQDRIGSLDFLRGVAILGILIINIESFCYPEPWSPYKYGFESEADHTIRYWIYLFCQGKFFSIFALLFGAGFFIFLERMSEKGSGVRPYDIYSKRLIWLFVIGVAHAYLLWDGDILFHYAACGFFLFPFRSLGIKKLTLVLLIPVSIVLYKNYEKTERLQKQFDNYQKAVSKIEAERDESDNKLISSWEKRTSKGEAIRDNVENKRNSYWASVLVNAQSVKIHQGNIFFKGILFQTLILMLLGMLLYQSGVFRNHKSIPYYWGFTLAIFGVAISVNHMKYYHWTFEYDQPVLNLGVALITAFSKELMGLSYILMLNGIYPLINRSYVSRLLSQVGRMALSNYILQSLICSFIFYGYGLAQFNSYPRTELLYFVIGISIIQIIFSWVWLKYYKYGPLEWVWRSLTYWKKIEIKK